MGREGGQRTDTERGGSGKGEGEATYLHGNVQRLGLVRLLDDAADALHALEEVGHLRVVQVREAGHDALADDQDVWVSAG
jgi:hypothetical protein